MAEFTEVDRPETNRRHIRDRDLDWDRDLEDALLRTRETGRAIIVPLVQFHKSPAKGRLWKRGYKVRHRVVEDDVHAWVEDDTPATAEPSPAQPEPPAEPAGPDEPSLF